MSEEKQMTLMDLLMELRTEANPEAQKTAWQGEQKRAFVEKNRSGIMSGFIKSLRMQNRKHALFYGSLLLQGGMSTFYVKRRLLIDACEDGVDVNVIEYMVSLFQKKDKDTTKKDVLRGAMMICGGSTWWNCDYGKRKNLMFLTSKKVPTPTSESIDELMDEMEQVCFEGGFQNAKKSSAILRRLRELKQNPHDYHEWLTDACVRKGKEIGDENLVRVGIASGKVLNRKTDFKDGNWQLVLRYMLCMGSEPDVPSMEEAVAKAHSYDALIDKFLNIAEEKLKEPDKIELPSWAYDGMHASNKKLYSYPDKRFPGTEQGFYNCALMADKNGRLDPRDQAELDGLQVPDEYLKMYNEWVDDIE